MWSKLVRLPLPLQAGSLEKGGTDAVTPPN